MNSATQTITNCHTSPRPRTKSHTHTITSPPLSHQAVCGGMRALTHGCVYICAFMIHTQPPRPQSTPRSSQPGPPHLLRCGHARRSPQRLPPAWQRDLGGHCQGSFLKAWGGSPDRPLDSTVPAPPTLDNTSPGGGSPSPDKPSPYSPPRSQPPANPCRGPRALTQTRPGGRDPIVGPEL